MFGPCALLRLLPPLLLLLLGSYLSPATASLCACDKNACPPVSCPVDRSPVLDTCNCCMECGKAEGERCGGNFELMGRCSEGLECRRQPPKPGQLISQATEGICARIGCDVCQLIMDMCVCTEVDECPDVSRDPTSFIGREECEKARARPKTTATVTVPPTVDAAACADVSCRLAAEGTPLTGCPVDSVVKMAPSSRPECCPPVAECVCDLESCPRRPECDHGQPTRVRTGKRQPGHCCSIWACKVNTVISEVNAAAASPCANVTCPAAAACPPDSYRTPASDGCCPGECVCQPVPCPPPSCLEGTRLRIALQATGRPGACCSVFQCENSSCVHDGKIHQEGDTWRLDQCTNCHCKDAVSFCDKIECPELGSCAKSTEPGQCCPRCIDGCLSPSGLYHNNSEQWQEDDCTTCSCIDNKLHCHIPLCNPPCRDPTPVPGRCCPVCKETECGMACEHGYRADSAGRPLCECRSASDVDLVPRPQPQPPRCRNISSCKKSCSHGFKLDANGCERCKCHHCRRMKGCSLSCPLAVNDRGCKVCRCRQGSASRPTLAPTPTPTPTPTVDILSCVTTDGEVHAPGTSWNDGCRQCFCHDGTEMCAMIACSVPNCEHPEIEPGHCCPTCPDELPEDSRHVNLTVCLSASGGTYLDGQTWQLDSCTLCMCRGGRVLCNHPACPPAACPQPERRPGDCCATCPGDSPTGGSTERPIDGSSGSQACPAGPGPSWPDGAAWRSSACVSCRCRDGATRCYHEQCLKLDCDRPVLSKGRCCPHCIEATSDGSCVNGNRTLASGESWQVDACKSCVCRDGQLSCAQKVCSSTCRGLPPPGHCCPVCKEELAANSRRNYPFLNGTSKVGHRIRVPEPHPPTQTPQPELEETDGSQSSLLHTVVYPILGVAALAVIGLIFLCIFLLRRRSAYAPKQPLPVEEEKKPLNGAQTIDFTHPGGISTLQNNRPPEPRISIIRHA